MSTITYNLNSAVKSDNSLCSAFNPLPLIVDIDDTTSNKMFFSMTIGNVSILNFEMMLLKKDTVNHKQTFGIDLSSFAQSRLEINEFFSSSIPTTVFTEIRNIQSASITLTAKNGTTTTATKTFYVSFDLSSVQFGESAELCTKTDAETHTNNSASTDAENKLNQDKTYFVATGGDCLVYAYLTESGTLTLE